MGLEIGLLTSKQQKNVAVLRLLVDRAEEPSGFIFSCVTLQYALHINAVNAFFFSPNGCLIPNILQTLLICFVVQFLADSMLMIVSTEQ